MGRPRLTLKRKKHFQERPGFNLFEFLAQSAKTPKRLTVSQCADSHRVIPAAFAIDGVGGKWQTETTPYLREIMDSFGDPSVTLITFMKSTQVGGTEAAYNDLHHIILQSPGPTIVVMPDEKVMRKAASERIIPVLESSAAIRAHMSGLDDDKSALKLKFDRMTIFFTWSNSPSALSSFPCRYVILDEIDKYPRFSGREATPTKLAMERAKNFWNRKIFQASTPTTRAGYIFQAFEGSDKRRYHMPCKHCGVYQTFKFDQIKVRKTDRDWELVKMNRLAWYECSSCNGIITDRDKTEMLRRGVWCPDGCRVENGKVTGDIPQTTHRGYHINSIYSPWLTFSDVMAEFLESVHMGDRDKIMNFTNSWLGEIFEEKNADTKVADIEALKIPYAPRTVPAGVVSITAGADVQIDRVYYSIRGRGYGDESWLIDHGVLKGDENTNEIFKLNDAVLNRSFQTQDGKFLTVRLLAVDAGYRPDEVYEFARHHLDRVVAVLGARSRMPVPYTYATIDKFPGTKKAIPGGLQRAMVDTDYYKDKMQRIRSMNPPRWHIHPEVDRDYVWQVAAEHRIVERNAKGIPSFVWRTKPGISANHYGDTEVYSEAAMEMLGLAMTLMKKPSEVTPQKIREVEREDPADDWINRIGSGGFGIGGNW